MRCLIISCFCELSREDIPSAISVASMLGEREREREREREGEGGGGERERERERCKFKQFICAILTRLLCTLLPTIINHHNSFCFHCLFVLFLHLQPLVSFKIIGNGTKLLNSLAAVTRPHKI